MHHLPYDVERLLLEYAAESYPHFAPVLARLSKMTQVWVEKVMYRVIYLRNMDITIKFMRTIKLRPQTFFLANVKALSIPFLISSGELIQLFAFCANITSLSCWTLPKNGELTAETVMDMIQRLPLKALGIRLQLYRDPSDTIREEPMLQRLPYHQLTHIDIYDPKVTWLRWSWMGWEALTNLTHIIFFDPFKSAKKWSEVVTSANLKFLEICPKLRICLFYTDQQSVEPILSDARIVFLVHYWRHHRDWVKRKRGHWSDIDKAEIIVERRHCQ